MKYFLIIALITISACGVKPGQLSPKNSSPEQAPFPAQYPAP